MDVSMAPNSPPSKKKRTLSKQEKKLMFDRLLTELVGGKFKRGSISTIAASFSVNRKTVTQFWKKAIARATEVDGPSETPRKVGRKRMELDPEKVANIDPGSFSSVRTLAKALNMSRSTVHRMIKDGALQLPPKANSVEASSCNQKEEARTDRMEKVGTGPGVLQIPAAICASGVSIAPGGPSFAGEGSSQRLL